MKQNKIYFFAILALFIFEITQAQNKNHSFKPGKIWLDTDGNAINAHGGGILFYKGTYYWYGEIKKGATTRVPNPNWENYRVDASGVSCYSSKDLYNWKYEGVVLKPEEKDTTSQLHISKVIERPKVIYNDKTKKFVMWFHLDTENYELASSGVATSDSPTKPFTYRGSTRPNGKLTRDQTLFKDHDGKAYQVCASEGNATLYVNELTDDYLNVTGRHNRNFIDLHREAPAIVKNNNKYYVISSGCTGWDPNSVEYGVSDSIMGDFKIVGDPCKGKDAKKTYYAQSTYILPIQGQSNEFIAMFDKWNKLDLENSRYIWLPLTFENGKMIITWKEEWKLK